MEGTPQISVSIVEDNKLIRDNLIQYIKYMDDITLINSSGSVESFLHSIEKDPRIVSDIVLLDIGLPGMSGLEGIAPILEKQPEANIVMLTTYEEEDKIIAALCSGAVGYISKKTSLADIMEAIRVVYGGGSYMSPSVAREITNHFAPKSIAKKNNILTDRQTLILALLTEGLSYAAVGSKLGISKETVKTHIKRIYKALKVPNKASAISKFVKGQI